MTLSRNPSKRMWVVLTIVPCTVAAFGQVIDLPTSKQILRPVPGSPQRLNSLPMSMTVSPDARYVVTVNAGYGTFESKYMQSLAVLDTQTGKVEDFPDARLTMIGPDKKDGSLEQTRRAAESLQVLDRLALPGAVPRRD